MDYDFSGWATRNNIKCSDGRTIMKDAFKHNDGQKVPLVWNHQHNDPNEVLGHALLENRDEGVYAYCKFNDTESGQTARSLVLNGDVDKLSIYANKLKSQMNKVTHGCIREVSLVLAGANPGAYIDSVVMHSDDSDETEEEGTIYTDEPISIVMEHSDDKSDDELSHKEGENNVEDNAKQATNNESSSNEKTVQEVFDTLTDEQKDAVYAIIGQAVEDAGMQHSDDDNDEDEEYEEEEGEDNMKHNVFDQDKNNNDALMHSEIIADAIADAKKYGSMKESFLEHAAANNIENLDYLFPEATELYKEPKLIEKDNSWVAKVINGVKHTPFSRVKTTFATLNEEQARAKGYIKGNMKKDIAMALLRRVTTPTTVYIKNKIDRDDVVDITDFDIVAWQKREMRKQLDKELALSILVGDGRSISDEDKINEQNIRPIVSDASLYTIQYTVKEGQDYKITDNSFSENDSKSKGIIRAAIKSRKDYKGSGQPTFYTSEDVLTDMLLIEDQNGRLIYDSVEKLATAMRVKEIVTIPEFENRTDIYGIIVNLEDYTAGADKGGSVNMFDDFDIDYNQMKYLMETRMSGALTVPYSAIVLRKTDFVADNHIGG